MNMKGSYINNVTLFRGEGMGWGKAKCYIVLYYRRQGGVGQRYMTHNYYLNVKFYVNLYENSINLLIGYNNMLFSAFSSTNNYMVHIFHTGRCHWAGRCLLEEVQVCVRLSSPHPWSC